MGPHALGHHANREAALGLQIYEAGCRPSISQLQYRICILLRHLTGIPSPKIGDLRSNACQGNRCVEYRLCAPGDGCIFA